jgi:hypothetical protein
MTEGWYTAVAPETPLTQGDFILDCPLLAWAARDVVLDVGPEGEFFRAATRAIRADVVVMTQACDLENHKVSEVILCPQLPVSEYRGYWEEQMIARNQTPTARAWRNHWSDICDGYLWNLAMLKAGRAAGLATEHRIVDFHEVYTVPREFLESLNGRRAQPRLRLLPPYREHLSQAFARFFMRVGLPVAIVPLP